MMSPEERRGRDIWDKLRMQAAAPKPKPVMEWPSYYPPYPPQSPSPPGAAKGDRATLRGPVHPKPKPTDEERQQAPLSPKPTLPPRQKWRGRGTADPYADPKSRADLMRGAYQAGLNGDAGAAGSFPRGSEYERAYRKGLADRRTRDQSMRRYRPEAG